MKTLSAAAAVLATLAFAAPASQRSLSKAVLEDKIRGGWAGQMIGVSYGAPTEFRSNGKIIEGNLNQYLDWSPARLENAIDQDDLYVEMTFAEVMDKVGLEATTEQYGAMFKDSKYQLWHANAGARRALNRGIASPMSGHPQYNLHADDIDFQIESDFIGLMTPGLPREANRYADRVGRVMNWGDGLYGGMFFAGMYSAAFFETDPRKVVEQGLRSIPAESAYGRIVADVLVWSAQHPDDWTKTWGLLQDKWDKDDLCPDGALAPFNIDAKLNGAYVALGLVYGRGDFAKTLEVSTRAGQDSDCNPSSAAGILGVMLGYEKIPDVWKSGIPAIADTRFSFTQYSFNEIVASTMRRAEKVIAAAGGRVTDKAVFVPAQAPQAPPLEQWRADPPRQRVAYTDPAWTWNPGFMDGSVKSPGDREMRFKEAKDADAEAELAFEGTGVAIVGRCSQDGGRADVVLDGQKAGEIDAWIPANTHDNDYWHVTGLR
ncbi:MAG TPA: ADP-ribosylglycohydrolase family protein, partial [Vicinamibacteria bacterium]|nr:ADP-ribosylglycohydrolase family protein [Vicinamibacteria bacterium]